MNYDQKLFSEKKKNGGRSQTKLSSCCLCRVAEGRFGRRWLPGAIGRAELLLFARINVTKLALLVNGLLLGSYKAFYKFTSAIYKCSNSPKIDDFLNETKI
jgi:hypothetical protein